MTAPDTSSYILAFQDAANLENSRTLETSGGLNKEDNGSGRTFTITTVGNLANLNQFSVPGFVAYDSSNQIFIPQALDSGTGIEITNPSGQLGDTTISVVPGSTVQKIQVQKDAVIAGDRAAINFIAGPNTSITAGDNVSDGRIDITIGTSTGFSPNTSTYILQTPDAGLPNAQALDTLVPGVGGEIVKVSPAGVLSTAVANTDYQSASAILTSISAVTPTVGTFLEGDGTGFSGITIGPAGNIWTSNGTQGFWGSNSGFTVNVLNPFTIAVTLSNKTIYVPTSTTDYVRFTLPIASPGDVFEIRGFGTIGWIVSPNPLAPGQIIHFGSNSTTAVTGSLSSTSRWDWITITCVTANDFIAGSPFGNPNTF